MALNFYYFKDKEVYCYYIGFLGKTEGYIAHLASKIQHF